MKRIWKGSKGVGGVDRSGMMGEGWRQALVAEAVHICGNDGIASKYDFMKAYSDQAARHDAMMARALALAKAHLGDTSPNPTVGAVIVKDGQIIAEGWHRGAGHPHAEIVALQKAGEDARGADLYVTLEPCNHHGRTPPCSQAIIDAGIARVFYATPDPNPLAQGGAARMEAAGIEVSRGPREQEAREINRFFFHYIQQRRPYVIAKFASSLDGKIATYRGESQWITGPEARSRGHELRRQVDAILVGVGTAIADDPMLTARRPDGALHPHQPVRILLDSRGRTPLRSRLFQPHLPAKTVVATTSAMPSARREILTAMGVDVIVLPADRNGQVEVTALLDYLGEQRLMSLLVEGGGKVLGSFFQRQVVQEVWAFLAPMIIGGDTAPGPVGGSGFGQLAQAPRLTDVRVERLGEDWLIRGKVRD